MAEIALRSQYIRDIPTLVLSLPTMNNPLASGKIICPGLWSVFTLLSSQPVFKWDDTWTHPLKQRVPKMFVFMGKHRIQAALTCPGQHWPLECYTYWWRDQRVPCIALNPVPRGAQFPVSSQHLTQVNTPLKGLRNMPGSKHQSGSFHHPTL